VVVPRLILNPGKSDERAFELREGALTVGRADGNDLCVPHRSLSREHARVSVEGGRAYVEDLASRNGTFVDGVRVSRRELGKAHLIRCGDVLLFYQADGSLPPPAAETAPAAQYDVTCDPQRRPLGHMLTPHRALDGAALYVEAAGAVERANKKLQILLKVSELLSSPASLDDVVGKILDVTLEIMDVDRATVIMLRDGKPTPWVARARAGVPEEQCHSRQIVAHVVRHGMAALFSNVRSDPRLHPDDSIIDQSIWSAMCAPLRVGDRLLGALYVDNITLPNRFTEEDLQFLSAFSNQAAIGVENALLGEQLVQEAATRRGLMRFFSPTMIDTIVQSADSLEVRETAVTALFCALTGYTELCSRLPPREVLGLLNAYFPAMAEIVFHHEGTLEKYVGDALLAVWGAPFGHADDPERAVRAAVDMQRAMRRLTQGGRLASELAIHVGIASGIAAAGRIGSEQYLQYATVGEPTNVASRICTVAQDGQILVDKRTAGGLASSSWSLVGLEPTRVKGKAKPLTLFRVQWE
jgi:adenylate cyclase